MPHGFETANGDGDEECGWGHANTSACRNAPRNVVAPSGPFLAPPPPPPRAAANMFLLSGGAGARVLHVRIGLYGGAYPKQMLMCVRGVPRNDFVYPGFVPRRVFCASAVYPQGWWCPQSMVYAGRQKLGCRNSIAFGSAPRREADSQPIIQLVSQAVSQTVIRASRQADRNTQFRFFSVADSAINSGGHCCSQNKPWFNSNAVGCGLVGRRRLACQLCPI